MTACPARILRLNALLDGELDAANTLGVEEHLKACEGCRTEFARLAGVRETIRSAEARWTTPPALRTRVETLLDTAAAPRRRAPSGTLAAWSGGAGLGAIAASLAIALAGPTLAPRAIESEVLAGHVRSLLAAHLTDVATSDRHQVKPWFNGRVDFAPPVPELADQGFPLAGGRLDYIDGTLAAALVYRRRLHVINLFVWPAPGGAAEAPSTHRRQGYSLVDWRGGGLRFWAVSDIDPSDLESFAAAYRAGADAAGREPAEK